MSPAAGLGDFVLLLSHGCPPWPSLHLVGRHERHFGRVKATPATPGAPSGTGREGATGHQGFAPFAPASLQSRDTRVRRTKSPPFFFLASLAIGRVFALGAGVLF